MSSRLFIGNLSYNATEAELRAAFADRGYVPRTVTLVTDRETGQMRGFGFVELESEQMAREAIPVVDGTMVGGRPIRVNEAHEREQRGGAGGGRRPQVDHRGPPPDPERNGRGRRGSGEDRDRW